MDKTEFADLTIEELLLEKKENTIQQNSQCIINWLLYRSFFCIVLLKTVLGLLRFSHYF